MEDWWRDFLEKKQEIGEKNKSIAAASVCPTLKEGYQIETLFAYISLVLLYEESIEIIGLPVKEDKLLKSRIS